MCHVLLVRAKHVPVVPSSARLPVSIDGFGRIELVAAAFCRFRRAVRVPARAVWGWISVRVRPCAYCYGISWFSHCLILKFAQLGIELGDCC